MSDPKAEDGATQRFGSGKRTEKGKLVDRRSGGRGDHGDEREESGGHNCDQDDDYDRPASHVRTGRKQGILTGTICLLSLFGLMPLGGKV